jgi:tetratricopeptide (TPR) repeat protein
VVENLKTSDLEDTILCQSKKVAPVSLERTLLILSGLNTDAEIRSYHDKIDDIFGRFLKKCDCKRLSDQSKAPSYLHRTIAKCLSQYLWTSKPKRFGEHFLLTDVVDAQLNHDVNRLVGTCVGLTSLYSVLGLRAGLDLSLLVASDHLMSRLRMGKQTIDIDHTDPQGFDCPNGEGFCEFPLPTLTANVLNSRGLRSERSGQFEAAKADYQKAILVNPEYPSAFNNRGNMSFRDEDMEGAIADYTEALRLNPSFCEAYCNRGIAKQRLGRLDEAREDYRMAIDANPEYEDARRCLQVLEGIEDNNS